MNEYQKCWWEQARSDHEVLLLLRNRGVPSCHQLHYLQMITEKLSKAYLWRSGKPPKMSHKCFGLFMRLLLQVPTSERQKVADTFDFKRFKDFQNWARQAMPLVYSLERLAPALAQEGPNPEYPWPSDLPTNTPATYQFDVWRDLRDTSQGRRLLSFIESAVKEFGKYGG